MRCRNVGMDFTNSYKLVLLREAYEMALLSPDPSTQNGSIIVDPAGRQISRGYNGFPEGVRNTPDRLRRPLKYAMVEHAERWSIFEAAKKGRSTKGATMFCPWFACADCGRAIIAAGIKKVIGHQRMFDATPDRWNDSIAVAFTMFKEAGVETELIQGEFDLPPIRFNEQLWTP